MIYTLLLKIEWTEVEITITKPKITSIQNPVSPTATIPPSKDPMIIHPIKVPKIVPIPPKAEVPPRKTAAIALSRYPSPNEVQKYNASRLTSIPAKAAKNPNCAKTSIFTLFTGIPIILALSILSPVKNI